MTDGRKQGDAARAQLGELVFRFLEEREKPGASPVAILDALCEQHSDLAARLRSAVARLSLAGFGLPNEVGSESEGERVVGPFRLVSRLGAGGMGVVHRAVRTDGSGEPVALKLLHPRQQNEPGMRERFAREVEAIERLDHPGIVRVVDHGEVIEGEVSLPYLAMTYQPGVTLESFIAAAAELEVTSEDGTELGQLLHAMAAPKADSEQRAANLRGPWWKVVAHLGSAVASAMEHAHGRGVVHRDIKPSNLIMTPDGQVMLLDFGLASVQDASRLTRTGAQLGSLPYMAPEQLGGGQVGPASDVYGLGLVLYELLALQPAFEASNWNDVVSEIQHGKRLRPSREVPYVPAAVAAELDAIVERATQPEVANRFSSAAALAQDLDALRAGRRTSARPLGPVKRAFRAIRRRPLHTTAVLSGAGLIVAAVLIYGSYESELINTEIAAIERQVDSVRSGVTSLSEGTLGDDPRFAPTALPSLIDGRERITEARTRLRELEASGEDVTELAREADVVISDLIIGIANSHSTLGDHAVAIEAYRERVEHTGRMLEEWSAEGESVPAFLITEHGRSYGMLARAIHLAGPVEAAAEEARRSVDAIEQVIERTDASKTTYSQLLGALLIQTEAHVRSGDLAAARRALDRAEKVSLNAFGDDPEALRQRSQRAEIELRRVRYGLIEGGRPARIAALERAADWLDSARESVERDATVAVIRIDIGMQLVFQLRRDRQFEEALEVAMKLVERCDRILAARGALPESDDTFAAILREAKILVTLLQADTGGEVERAAKLTALWDSHENSRQAFLERPFEVEALSAYLKRAGTYANQAAFEPDAAGWEVERAIGAVDAALEAAQMATYERSERAEGLLVYPRQHCVYARGLAQVRAGRIRDAYQAVRELEALGQGPAGGAWNAMALRMAADLCSELLALEQDAAGAESLATRTVELLGQAVDAGFNDLKEVQSTAALDPLREDPRFQAIVERMTSGAEGD